MDKLKKVLDYVTEQEDRYYECAYDTQRGDVSGYLLNVTQATSFQKVRYFIEEMIEGEYYE